LTDSFEESLARIRAVGENFRRMFGEVTDEAKAVPVYLAELGLTPSETNAWQQFESDFAKRIATPLPTKLRRRVTLLEVT
jgi:hypothetical protein